MALNLKVEGSTPPRVMSPYLPLDPFSSRERPRSSKKGAAATSVQTFTFFQVLDPLLRPERPRSSKKGRRNLTSKRAAIWFFSVPWPHIEALLLSALSVPVCLSGLLSFGRSLSRNTVRNDLCRAHLAHQAGLAQLVEQMAFNLKVEHSTPPRVMSPYLPLDPLFQP